MRWRIKDSLFPQALAEIHGGQHESAERLLKQVLAEDPRFEDAYEALAVLYFNLKRYDEALTLVQKWIGVNPNSIMAQVNLSRTYAAKGMILEAEKAQAESRRLTWKAELKAKKLEMPKVDFPAQIERFKKVIAFDPKDVLGYFSLGNTYLDSGMIREAADTLEKAVKVDPHHSSSYLSLGQALEALGDKKKAQEIYQKGIKVADAKGDLMTLKKMESRLRALNVS